MSRLDAMRASVSRLDAAVTAEQRRPSYRPPHARLSCVAYVAHIHAKIVARQLKKTSARP